MAGTSAAPEPLVIIRKSEAARRTGLSAVHMWRLEKVGRFPHRIQLSERAIGYLEHEISDWIHDRVRAAGRFTGRPSWAPKQILAPEPAAPPQADLTDQHETSDVVVGAGRLRKRAG
jgi:predicted DNA-binding transcriptional regulator AlpA